MNDWNQIGIASNLYHKEHESRDVGVKENVDCPWKMMYFKVAISFQMLIRLEILFATFDPDYG